MTTRACSWGTALLLAALTACAAPAPAPAGPPPAATPSRVGGNIPDDLRVRHPKDARGIPICTIIPADQLVALGLLPDTAKEELGDPGDPVAQCDWKHATDRLNDAGFLIRTDTESSALVDKYRRRDTYLLFEPTEVAGHPAVMVRETADYPCVAYVAIADDQIMNASGNTRGRPETDPDRCSLARRLAEAVLANLPDRGATR